MFQLSVHGFCSLLCFLGILTTPSQSLSHENIRGVLMVGEELWKESLPLRVGSSRIYQLHGLKPLKWYEVKISYPASIPASFSIQLKRGESLMGLYQTRRLLNTEKLIFMADGDQLSESGGGLYVLVSVEPAGFVAFPNVQERQDVIYNIGNGKVGLQYANDAEMTTDEASPPHENFEEESLRTSDTDFETSILNIGNSLRKDEETHQAIIQLRDKVRELQDRETKLERKLLGYYRFKEQQTAFMELQNRLKISILEAKLFDLKIESLQADNKKMEAQLVEYCRVVDELESAKAKIKMLKRKIRSEEEQNKKEISSLQQMLKRVEDKETNYNADTLAKLDRLRELEDVEMQLRRENAILQLENSEFG